MKYYLSLLLLNSIALAQAPSIDMSAFTNTKGTKIDFVTVRECKDLVWGKFSEDEHQDKINKKLKEAMNKAKAKFIYTIQYGNDQSGLLRNKDNACIVATAWIAVPE